MRHVYSVDEDRLYSFPRSSVVTIDHPTPRPAKNLIAGGTPIQVVEGEPVFYAGIAITNLCNLTCLHCPVSVTTTGVKRRDWQPEEFADLIDALAERGLTRVSITGGEPFMHPQLLQLFDILHTHGIESKINTNGLCADPETVLRLADRGLIEVDVSINDPVNDEASYRHVSDFANDRVSSAATLANRVGGTIQVTASSVLTKRMLTRLDETAYRLARIGVDRWRLREMLPSLDREPESDLVPTLAETRAALTEFIKTPLPLEVYGYLVDSLRGAPSDRRCRNLERNYVYVSYDGECWWMAGLSGAPLGNAHTQDAKELSGRLRAYRLNLSPPGRCVTCPARFICSESPQLTA